MKPAILLAAMAAASLAACNPSQFFKPDKPGEELLGGPSAASGTFPSGSWEDGQGNVWAVTIKGRKFVSRLAPEKLAGLSQTGSIDGDTLTYTIGLPDDAPIARGSARLIDSEHAFFKTLSIDGSIKAHGLFHFNHSAQTPVRQPGDLQPVSNGANLTRQGD